MTRIGILCPSEIALRRFMPALLKCPNFAFAGIAIASPEEWFGEALSATAEEAVAQQQRIEIEKARVFTDTYGGALFDSYRKLLMSDQIDAVYIPLPPGLHSQWAKQALLQGKHVLIEKPATIRLEDSRTLLKIASERQLALHENYMFSFHRQLEALEQIIASGEIGAVRLFRISFGFPRRALNDFRYNAKLGGGALLDCGGYTLKYATRLLGNSARLIAATMNYSDEFEVDIFGSGTLLNSDGLTVQIAFGMDNQYKCDLEAWGSTGSLISGRVLTAPPGLTPTAVIQKGNERHTVELPEDDAFEKSILHFEQCITAPAVREQTYIAVERQAAMVEQFIQLAESNQA